MLSDHELYDRKIEDKWAKNDAFDEMAENVEEELRLLRMAWKFFREDPKLTNNDRLGALHSRIGHVYEMVEEIIEGGKYA